MVSINLLPWRDYLQIYQQRYTLKLIFHSFLLAILMLIGLTSLLNKQIASLHSRINLLRQPLVDQFNHKSAEEQPLDFQFVNRLSEYQGVTQKLFQSLRSSQQAKVCFTEIKRSNGFFYFSGNTRSLSELTHFLMSWKIEGLFSEIKLEELTQKENKQMQFRFKATESHYVL